MGCGARISESTGEFHGENADPFRESRWVASLDAMALSSLGVLPVEYELARRIVFLAIFVAHGDATS